MHEDRGTRSPLTVEQRLSGRDTPPLESEAHARPGKSDTATRRRKHRQVTVAHGLNTLRARDGTTESERQLAFHLQHTPIAAIEWNLDFEVSEWNPAAEKIFGYSKAEALGRHAADLIVPASARAHVNQVWTALLKRKGGYRSTNQNLTKDGRTIYCDWNNTPLVDGRGRVCGVASLTQDVTDRALAEKALRDSNDLLAALSEAQSMYIAEVVPRDVFEKLLESLLGLSQSEYGFIGEIFHETDGQPFLRTYAITNIAWNKATRELYDHAAGEGMVFHNRQTLFGAVITSGKEVISNDPVGDPRRGGLPKGHPPLRSFLGLPLRSGDKLVGIAGVANRPGGYDLELVKYLDPFAATCGNMIASHRLARKRRRAEEQAESLARFPGESPNPVLRCAHDGTILYSNESARVLLEHWGSDIGQAVPEAWRRTIAQAVSSGTPQEVSLDVDGRRLLLDLVPVQGTGYINVYGRDITEQKRAEERLLQAQKMETMGRLAGGVAHDFNNLLTAITAHCELASMRLMPGHPLQISLDVIQGTAKRAADLTHQLLAFSRMQTLAPKVLDLNEVLKSMGSMLERIIGEDIELKIETAGGRRKTKVDQGQIEQVVINLAVNARDAMPKGGVLTLVAWNATADAARCALVADLRPGDYVGLTVSDTGIGISDEIKPKILEPFFTTKELGKGTGLGLATVYGIVKQSGGALSVESEQGKGTSFKIWLPAAEGDIETAAAPSEPAEPPRGTETILVVEDDDVVRKVVVSALQRQRYSVIDAANGKDALQQCRRHEAPVDLVITDMVMPSMNGRELAQAVREMWPDVKLLFMSGYFEDADTVAGNESFMDKPFGPKVLARRVRDLLDK